MSISRGIKRMYSRQNLRGSTFLDCPEPHYYAFVETDYGCISMERRVPDANEVVTFQYSPESIEIQWENQRLSVSRPTSSSGMYLSEVPLGPDSSLQVVGESRGLLGHKLRYQLRDGSYISWLCDQQPSEFVLQLKTMVQGDVKKVCIGHLTLDREASPIRGNFNFGTRLGPLLRNKDILFISVATLLCTIEGATI